jgi:hypothetical protein
MKPIKEKGTTQLLLQLHESGAREESPRLITTITPARGMYPRVQSEPVIKSAIAAAEEHERQLAFYNGGIKSVLRNEQELSDVIQAMALFRFSLEQEYIADHCCPVKSG